MEWTLHHLDLVAHLPDAAQPPAEGLARSRAMLEEIAGAAYPAAWSDRDALLVGTGRRAATARERAALARAAGTGGAAPAVPLVLG
jgi:hypothetical protein